jgi:hypothetical protein
MRPDLYTPTFRRALFSYVNNGFFARGLDADDIAFIEGVRERGSIACGTLGQLEPNAVAHGPVLAEELDFWENRWGVEPEVERVFAQPRWQSTYHSHDEYLKAVARRRALREHEKKISAEELAREQRAWNEQQKQLAKERDQRQMRMAQADIEWEKAHPTKVKNYKNLAPYEPSITSEKKITRSERHYVPQWKRDEEAAEHEALMAERAEWLRPERARLAKAMRRRKLRAKAKAERKQHELNEQARIAREASGTARAAAVARWHAMRNAEEGEAEAAPMTVAETRKAEADDAAWAAHLKATEREKAAPSEPVIVSSRKAKGYVGRHDCFESRKVPPPHPPVWRPPIWPHVTYWPQAPASGRMIVFSGVHVFVRNEDIGKLMMKFSQMLAFAEQRAGVSRFVTLNGLIIDPERGNTGTI